MRIEGVYLKEVGPFREAKLDIRPRQSADKADVHIFVGPNGSGKSTILYAMAAALAGPEEKVGGGQAFRRMPREDSMFALDMGEGVVAFARGAHNSEHAPIKDPFFNGAMFRHSTFNDNDSCLTSATPDPRATVRYWQMASRYVKAIGQASPLDFAAFAYSGGRSLLHYNFSAIEEPTDGPLAQSLSFDNTVDVKRLAQWLSATFAKRALAREQNNAADVLRFGSAIERVEQAVGDVVGGNPKLSIAYKPQFRIIVERFDRPVDLDLLPDGLKSILSWIADLLMRMDRIPWQQDTPILERAFVLLLDEIDVHLHPAWQRKVLPMVQKLFPRAQIFVTTHSPFVVSSVSDAWVYPLNVNGQGEATVLEPVEAQAGTSFGAVLKGIFGVEEEFDEETEQGLREFYALRERVLRGKADQFDELKTLADRLAGRGLEVRDIVGAEINQVARRLGRRS